MIAHLHDDGYTFIGPNSINKLTMQEVRVLNEGKYQNAEERKRKRRANQNRGSGSTEPSETRMEIERSRDMNDAKMVQEMANGDR